MNQKIRSIARMLTPEELEALRKSLRDADEILRKEFPNMKIQGQEAGRPIFNTVAEASAYFNKEFEKLKPEDHSGHAELKRQFEQAILTVSAQYDAKMSRDPTEAEKAELREDFELLFGAKNPPNS